MEEASSGYDHCKPEGISSSIRPVSQAPASVEDGELLDSYSNKRMHEDLSHREIEDGQSMEDERQERIRVCPKTDKELQSINSPAWKRIRVDANPVLDYSVEQRMSCSEENRE